MCSYKILHHSHNGYVVKCHHCSFLKVAFGTTGITFNREQFYDFKKMVETEHELNAACACRSQKGISIPTSHQSLELLYTYEELEQLKKLLEEAYLALEIEQLFAV